MRKDATTVLKLVESAQLAMSAVGRDLDLVDVVGLEELKGAEARAAAREVRREEELDFTEEEEPA